ncbi:MAG: hypothetical protein V3W34_20525 [Phycisphaerae bacterium]
MTANILTISIVCVSLVAGTGGLAIAQPSAPVCDTSGGPEICVRFDNLADPPIEGTHFDFSFAFGVPSVDFTEGDNGLGTTFEWRMWSWDDSTTQSPRGINNITGLLAEDYSVKVLQPDGDPGATNVGKIDLNPSDAGNFSRIPAGEITGDLTGDLLVQKSSGGSGGNVDSFTIGGDATGDITIPTLDTLVIEVSAITQNRALKIT